ncbi:hypothetical protein HETIRDRAFT_312274 [Heterobasidion irregulare TC 32-1]|uniref:Uncharacterized protein n=1 Tax=Heterobasidion irregulare (strain TC 32-1) TaxID=747525 RepID=W4KIG8_HETIT|nr:uncharacterized protein HETIRDRAFT_312274 [Heterobasidion irregulare TC 32-1]ETW84836.1 hypothetical protein HETIRDRAFT_312274 [Heterobasidion irregulare TC 32-1]
MECDFFNAHRRTFVFWIQPLDYSVPRRLRRERKGIYTEVSDRYSRAKAILKTS